MTRVLRHIALVWVLTAAQAIGAIAGPAGVVVCREADGSAHVELLGEACCLSELEVSCSPAVEADDTPDAERACAGDDCDDSRIGQEPALRKPRANAGADHWVDVCVPVACDFDSQPGRVLCVNGRPTSITGPPRQVRCVLRSTILIR
jgi:hypothetical protein